MSTQRISTLVFYSLGVELTFQLFQSLLPSADKLQVGQSQLDLILEKSFLSMAVRLLITSSVQPAILGQRCHKFTFHLPSYAWKYFIRSFWGASKTQISFNPTCEGLSFSTRLNYFCRSSDVSCALSFPWISTDSWKHCHSLSHHISTGVSQEYPSFSPCRWDFIWQ